jgi:hypothetical protein
LLVRLPGRQVAQRAGILGQAELNRPDFFARRWGILARIAFTIAWTSFFLYNSYKIESNEIDKELMGRYNELS